MKYELAKCEDLIKRYENDYTHLIDNNVARHLSQEEIKTIRKYVLVKLYDKRDVYKKRMVE